MYVNYFSTKLEKVCLAKPSKSHEYICKAFNLWLFLCSFHSLYGKKTTKKQKKTHCLWNPSKPFK